MPYGPLKYLGFSMLITSLAWNTSCKKPEEAEPLSPVIPRIAVMSLSYTADNGSFQIHEGNYTSRSGYAYNVTRLSYYLSRIRLLKADNSSVTVKDHHYADASAPLTNRIDLTEVPEGEYTGITFNVGLDSVQNTSNALPANTENINMQWPEPMGGGYHFLKLEGYYKDNSVTHGYALHLGRNLCFRNIKLYKGFQVTSKAPLVLRLEMNVNEWFDTPHTYDFNKDGNYIMGNDSVMKKIAANGLNAFTFYP